MSYLAAMDSLKSAVASPSNFSNPMAAVTAPAIGLLDGAIIPGFEGLKTTITAAVTPYSGGQVVPSGMRSIFQPNIGGHQVNFLNSDNTVLNIFRTNTADIFDQFIAAFNSISQSYKDLQKHTDQITGVTNDPSSESPSLAQLTSVTGATPADKLCGAANSMVAIMKQIQQFKDEWNALLAALANLPNLLALLAQMIQNIQDGIARDKQAFKDAVKNLAKAAAAYVLAQLLDKLNPCKTVILDTSISGPVLDKIKGVASAKEAEFDKVFDKV